MNQTDDGAKNHSRSDDSTNKATPQTENAAAPQPEHKSENVAQDTRQFHWHVKCRIDSAIKWLNQRNGLMTAAATVIMAIFTGYLVKFVGDQGIITERQLNLMKRQIDAAERPWVVVSFNPIGPLRFEDGEGSIQVQITFKNTGHTPAIGVTTYSEGYFPNTAEEIQEKQNIICNSVVYSPGNLGDTIFPGESIAIERDVYFSSEEVAKGNLPIKGLGLFRNPTIAVCVNYKFSFDLETNLRSSLTWQLLKKPNGSRIMPDRTVPLSDLLTNSRRLEVGSRAD